MTLARTSPSGHIITSDNVANASAVAGSTVTAALDALAGLITPVAPLSALLWVDRGTAVPTPSQNGSIAAPNKTIQGGVDASPSTGAALFIVGSDYSSEAVSVVGASKLMSFVGTDAFVAILTSITSAATFRCQRLLLTGALTSSDSLYLVDTSVGGPVTAPNNLFASGHSLGSDGLEGITGPVTAGLLTASNYTFGDTVDCTAVMTADDCIFSGSGAVTAAGATLSDCTVFSPLHVVDLNAVDCIFGAAVTCTGSAIIQGCTFSGNLTVTGVLTIDSETYLTALNQGHTITAGTLQVVGGAFGATQKQLAWNPASAANSNVLTVMPAGHAPGIYQINVVMIVRALASAATSLRTTLVADGITKTAALNWTAGDITVGALPHFVTLTSIALNTVYSDGVNAMTVQMVSTVVTGTPSIDVFASASLVGQG